MIKIRLIIIALILKLILLFLLMSCQRGENTNKEGPLVALVMKTLNNPFFIDMQRGAEEAAEELGITLLLQAAEREVDVEKQMQIIENLIQRDVDVLCITPSGSKEIVPAIVKANKADIPVLIVDTRVDSISLIEAGGKITTFIGSDNYDGGRIAGEYIVNALGGKGEIAILEGIPGHETGDARMSGFYKALEGKNGIKIVTSQTANWERNLGFNVFQNILQSYPSVKALFSCNDMMALGAVEAITAAGKTGQIVVVGFDAIEDAREAIRTGKMNGSVAQHPYDMGKLAIENAKKIIDGQKIPSYIPVKIDLVTKDNLK
jgi:ribose transport system substrate-binding protein